MRSGNGAERMLEMVYVVLSSLLLLGLSPVVHTSQAHLYFPEKMAWDAAALMLMPLALLAIVAAIPPLIVHLRAKNFATSVLVIAVIILNMQNFTHAAIWHSRVGYDWWNGEILCDIDVKLVIGASQAINGAIASIFRQVSIILDTDRMTVAPSRRQRRLTITIEVTLCIILPLLVMFGHYLIQRDRYWLRTAAGCIPSYDNNYAAPFLTYLWPMVVSLLAALYCIISVIRLCRHRKQMSAVLSQTHGATASRFYRLFLLTFAILAIYCPLAVITFTRNILIPMHMYSWSYTHPTDWSERIQLDAHTRGGFQNITFDRWAQILMAYLLFAFFGLGQEATEMYRAWLKGTKGLLVTYSTRKNTASPQLSKIAGSTGNDANVAFAPGDFALEVNNIPHQHQ